MLDVLNKQSFVNDLVFFFAASIDLCLYSMCICVCACLGIGETATRVLLQINDGSHT